MKQLARVEAPFFSIFVISNNLNFELSDCSEAFCSCSTLTEFPFHAPICYFSFSFGAFLWRKILLVLLCSLTRVCSSPHSALIPDDRFWTCQSPTIRPNIMQLNRAQAVWVSIVWGWRRSRPPWLALKKNNSPRLSESTHSFSVL